MVSRAQLKREKKKNQEQLMADILFTVASRFSRLKPFLPVGSYHEVDSGMMQKSNKKSKQQISKAEKCACIFAANWIWHCISNRHLYCIKVAL